MAGIISSLLGGSSNQVLRSCIAFDRTGDHISELPKGLYAINPDGSDCRHIRDNGRSPKWSPNGRWIAFVEDTEDNGWLASVFIMRPDGREARRVTFHHDVSATPPTWSPDSARLAYSLWLWQEKKHQVYSVHLSTGKTMQLTYDGDNAYPMWAPNNEIVFNKSTDPEQRSRLFVIGAEGNNERVCALFSREDSDPVWTYDGRKVVFRRGNETCVMNADGTELTTVGTHGRIPQTVISPDAQFVAYSSCDNTGASGFEIFVLPLNGGTERRIVANPCKKDKEVDSQDLSWSPYMSG